MNDKIIYQLTIEDVQTVAEEEFGRKLTSQEIEQITDAIGDQIPWHDAIQYVIKDKLKLEETE